MYPPGLRFHSTAGAEAYNQKNPARARQLAAEAGYKGEPVRLLTTQVFEHFYNMALVGTEQWKKAGFNIDMQVMDWGTLLARRNNPALYEMSTVGAPFLAEPSLTFTAGSERPGFWSSEAKDRIVGAFNAEMDMAKRTAMWPDVQRLIYTEVPFIKVGDQGAVRRFRAAQGHQAGRLGVFLGRMGGALSARHRIGSFGCSLSSAAGYWA